MAGTDVVVMVKLPQPRLNYIEVVCCAALCCSRSGGRAAAAELGRGEAKGHASL